MSRGFINLNILIALFIVPVMCIASFYLNSSALSASTSLKKDIKAYHTAAAGLERATPFYKAVLRHEIPAGQVVEIPQAEGRLNGMDIKYVAVTPQKTVQGNSFLSRDVIYEVISIVQADDGSLVALKKQIRTKYLMSCDLEGMKRYYLCPGYTIKSSNPERENPVKLIHQHKIPIEHKYKKSNKETVSLLELEGIV